MNRTARILSSLVSLLLLAALFWLTDIGRILAALASVRFETYGFAATLFASTYVLLGFRWRVLVEKRLSLTLRTSFEIVAVSYGVNKLLPANAGDVLRSKIAQRYVTVDSHGALLGLVAVERLFDVGTIGLAIVLSSLFLSDVVGPMMRVVAVGALVASTAVLLIATRVSSVTSWYRRLPLPEFVRRELASIVDAVGDLSAIELSVVGTLSLARWLIIGVAFQLLAVAAGIEVSLAAAVLVTTAMSLAAVLPLSPGGIGPVDAVGTGTLVLLNVEYPQALTLVILQRSLGLVLVALVGLAIYNYRLVVPPSNPRREENP